MLVHSTSDFLSLCLGIVKTSGVFPFLPSSSLGIVDVHDRADGGVHGSENQMEILAELTSASNPDTSFGSWTVIAMGRNLRRGFYHCTSLPGQPSESESADFLL